MPDLEAMRTIGVSARLRCGDRQSRGGQRKDQWGIEQMLSDWLVASGSLVASIPPPAADSGMQLALAWVERIDALVLQGGADVRETDELPVDRRDAFEMKLLKAAMARGIPVLGICRGMQFINVALGGSLRRLDVGACNSSATVHSDAAAYETHTHPVRIASHHEKVRLYGGTSGEVCSMHCHAIDRLGSGLEVEAWCPVDEAVEAVRSTDFPWVRGVQWHPEFHRPGLLPTSPLLEGFLEAAKL
jgi:putative glutamine amidotransferase